MVEGLMPYRRKLHSWFLGQVSPSTSMTRFLESAREIRSSGALHVFMV